MKHLIRALPTPVWGLALAGLLLTGCAMRTGLVDCPPTCGVDVTLPANAQEPPAVGNPFVRVDRGQQVAFQSAQPIVILFPEETPFVDAAGDLVYWFQVSGTTLMEVRDDRSQACTNWMGCKYIVVDGGNGNRPALDPYIIIHR